MKMRKNRDDIPEDGTDPQVWLDYLDGKLPEEERQHLEEEIAHSEFLREALEGLLPLKGTVAASDAFFPFPDGLETIAEAGATAVIQPGGSVRDPEVIAAADRLGVAMAFTGVRHFRH